MPRLRPASIAIGMVLAFASGPASAAPAQEVVARGGPKVYMGREIAGVMTADGADWLVRETREAEEQPDRMLDALRIKPGMTVADVGAGVGYTSVRMARRVGPKGTVLSTDVQPEMLRMLAENARALGVGNIKPIRCTPLDPKLPRRMPST